MPAAHFCAGAGRGHSSPQTALPLSSEPGWWGCLSPPACSGRKAVSSTWGVLEFGADRLRWLSHSLGLTQAGGVCCVSHPLWLFLPWEVSLHPASPGEYQAWVWITPRVWEHIASSWMALAPLRLPSFGCGVGKAYRQLGQRHLWHGQAIKPAREKKKKMRGFPETRTKPKCSFSIEFKSKPTFSETNKPSAH